MSPGLGMYTSQHLKEEIQRRTQDGRRYYEQIEEIQKLENERKNLDDRISRLKTSHVNLLAQLKKEAEARGEVFRV